MAIGYAAEEDVFGWSDLARWYRGHRWLFWGFAGLFFGWCIRGGFGAGGWEPIHGTLVYIPSAPAMTFLGWVAQVLGGALLLWGVSHNLQRRKNRRKRRLAA